MWMFIRTALIWLMAVALPVQGAAAATMLTCGPGHHGPSAAHSHVDGDPAHVHTDSESHTDAEERMVHGSGDASSPGHAHASADGGPSATADGNEVHRAAGKCSACASCCTVAVLPTSILSIAPPPAPDRVVTVFQAQAAVFMTGGPERPPRTILV